ncbi:MAG: lipid carrier protein [Rhodospirillaceae bacterium]|nr:lipid carrier protein [Rhodospirillaceae bacterium]
MAPPLSPILVAGLPLRILPLGPVQLALDALMSVIHGRHRDVFERLSGIEDPTFIIDPLDLPLLFILRAGPASPKLIVVNADDAARVDAPTTIRGPLLALIALLEGRTDGDALFFSRELVIEGDTEAVVALRNAVDDAEVDIIGDVLAAAGPLATPVGRALDLLSRLFSRAQADMQLVHDAVLEPANRRIDNQNRAQHELQHRIDDLGRRPAKRAAKRPPAARTRTP